MINGSIYVIIRRSLLPNWISRMQQYNSIDTVQTKSESDFDID